MRSPDRPRPADVPDLGDPALDPPLTIRDVERFRSKVDTTGSGCHLWTDGTNAKGYGRIKVGGRNGRTWLAHRLAFLIATGESPPLVLMHECDNPPCCRIGPGHVIPGTVLQNNRDAVARGLRTYQRRDGQCTNGHEMTEANTYRRRGDDYPVCRACMITNSARSEAKPEVKERRRARDRARHWAQREKRLQQMRDRRARQREAS